MRAPREGEWERREGRAEGSEGFGRRATSDPRRGGFVGRPAEPRERRGRPAGGPRGSAPPGARGRPGLGGPPRARTWSPRPDVAGTDRAAAEAPGGGDPRRRGGARPGPGGTSGASRGSPRGGGRPPGRSGGTPRPRAERPALDGREGRRSGPAGPPRGQARPRPAPRGGRPSGNRGGRPGGRPGAR
jgi:hypothetical protein